MNKIILCNMPMNDKAKPFVYGNEENQNVSLDFSVKFVINALMTAEIEDGDHVTIVPLVLEGDEKLSAANVAMFKEEFEMVTAGKNITIDFKQVKVPFSERPQDQEKLLKNAISTICEATNNGKEKTDVYYDMTFSAKSLPIIMFTVLRFVAKFLKCNIKNIVYSKAKFEGGVAVSADYIEMGGLYYLDSIVRTISCEDSEEAMNMLDILLG